MTPRIPITDRAFRYVPSHSTDIRERFEAERRRIANEQQNKFDNENLPERK